MLAEAPDARKNKKEKASKENITRKGNEKESNNILAVFCSGAESRSDKLKGRKLEWLAMLN